MSISDRKEERGRRSSEATLMVNYLHHIGRHQTDAGFSGVIGSALQDLRRQAVDRGLVVQEKVGLGLTADGRAAIEGRPDPTAAPRR
jgi:hypothetical protein